MMRRIATMTLWAGLLATLSLGAGASSYRAGQDRISEQDWTEALESLDPRQPMDYFELAEDIADQASDEPARNLARHVFALAGVLDPERLGRSACLALADLESDPFARRRLLALASLLDDENRGMMPALERDQTIPADVQNAVANALSYYRIGDGTRALRELRTPGAVDLLRGHEHVLVGGWARLESECEDFRGTVRPLLTEDELMSMLQFELAIAKGSRRTWSADVVLLRSEPLIEIDPERLDETLGVDAERTVYRNGQWVRPPAPRR